MLRRVGLLAVVLCLVIPQVAQERGATSEGAKESSWTPSVVRDYPVLDDFSKGTLPMSPEETRIRNHAQMEMARRQLQQLHEETDQLAVLASQLKAEVDRTGSQALSVEAMKKAQQIEKLAKKIRSNMKGL